MRNPWRLVFLAERYSEQLADWLRSLVRRLLGLKP